MYTNQRVRVRWNGTVSHDFMATNSIRQGSIFGWDADGPSPFVIA